jgi:hypothetical protein
VRHHQDDVLYKYREWYKSRAGDIEIVREHPIEPKLIEAQSLGPGPKRISHPNAYSMTVEWNEKPGGASG